MVGRSVRKKPEAAQKIQLVFAKLRDGGEGFGPSQNRKQREQQDLIQRVDHLDELSRVLQIRKMIQKNNALKDHTVDYLRCRHNLKSPNRINCGLTDSALPPCVTR